MIIRYLDFFSEEIVTNTKAVVGLCISFFLSLLFLFHFWSSTRPSEIVRIPEGSSIIQAGTILKEEHIIRSKFWFRVVGQLNDVPIKAGSYLFHEDEGIFSVVHRLSTGDYGDVYVRVTLPEGVSVKQMASILDRADLDFFDKERFIELGEQKEGYLYPDTYYLLPDYTSEDIIAVLESTFNERIREIDLSQSTHSLEDIVIMASLIEKEANHNLEEQKMVSGILWKRISIGMNLQVDAPFVYAINKGSSKLTKADLRSDHPYNTYTRKGLTPTPIGNPSLSALQAALEPTESPYLFYLHGRNGKIYYGRDHDEHVLNKQRYLR